MPVMPVIAGCHKRDDTGSQAICLPELLSELGRYCETTGHNKYKNMKSFAILLSSHLLT